MIWCLTYIILVGFGTSGLQNMVQQIWGYPSPKNPSTSRFWYLHALAIDVLDVVTLLIFLLMSLLYYFWTSLINIYISDLDVILAGKLGVGDIYYTWQNEPRNETKSKMIKVRLVYYATGVSILNSYKEKPPVKKLPIFSELIENSAKFIKNSGLTKWTQNLR